MEHPYLLDPAERTVAEELDHLHMTLQVLALNIRAAADRIAKLQKRVAP